MPALSAKSPANPLSEIGVGLKLGLALGTAIMTLAMSRPMGLGVLFVASFVYVLFLKRPRMVAALYAAVLGMLLLAASLTWFLPASMRIFDTVSLHTLLVPFLRTFTMMNVVLVLAITGNVDDLTSLLTRLRLPFWFYLPTLVMLRFIPVFMHDAKQIRESLLTRGWALHAGFVLRHPILTARLIFAPLLFRTLRSSENLGIAAELKGLHAGSRFQYRKARRLNRTEFVFLAIVALTLAATFVVDRLWGHLGVTAGVTMA